MIKRLPLLIFWIIPMLLGLCGCASATDPAMPSLIIGCEDDRPYNYTDEDGEAAGIDVEIAREACKRIGYAPVFQQIEWSKRDTLLNSHQVDCLWNCYSMEGQEDRYAWVGPYMVSRQAVAVLAESRMQSIQDLQGKRIAVKISSQSESIFLGKTDVQVPQVQNVYSLNDMDEVVTALRNDYVDACAGYVSALTELFKNTGVQYRFLEEDLIRAKLGVAFAKDSDAQLRGKLAAALEEMRADGTMEDILARYGLEAEQVIGGNKDA